MFSSVTGAMSKISPPKLSLPFKCVATMAVSAIGVANIHNARTKANRNEVAKAFAVLTTLALVGGGLRYLGVAGHTNALCTTLTSLCTFLSLEDGPSSRPGSMGGDQNGIGNLDDLDCKLEHLDC